VYANDLFQLATGNMKSTSTNEPIISVSGLRGTIGDQLTPMVAARYVAAFASRLPPGTVVIGRDGRSSGQLLSQAVSATLAAHGMQTLDLGIAATPTIGVQVRQQAAVAGIQISASHNPKEYNGLKLFGGDGRVLPASIGEQVLAAYRHGDHRWVGVDAIGSYDVLEDPHAAHAQRVLATVNSAAIQRRRFRVLLDSNHGAGSLLGRRLLSELGCELTILGDTPDGNFAHRPEPLASNLTSICEAVKTGGYDVGFCQDPDADRLAVIDEQGRYIGEELTLALCLLQALPSNPGAIVINCATSSIAKTIAARYDSQVFQSAVGEANVVDKMLAENAIFGGEGNGGPIDPRVGYVRDSFVGMARILDLLASSGKTISQLVSTLPATSMVKDKISLDTRLLPKLFELLTFEWSDASASQQDGLKLEWDEQWLLVRGSNTEPIVRLIAEAATTAQAQSLCDRARELANRL
jgi:phosphomannomutase